MNSISASGAPGLHLPDRKEPAGYRNFRNHTGPSLYNSPSNICSSLQYPSEPHRLSRQAFDTAKNLEFFYIIKGNEMFVTRKDKSVTTRSSSSALWNATIMLALVIDLSLRVTNSLDCERILKGTGRYDMM